MTFKEFVWWFKYDLNNFKYYLYNYIITYVPFYGIRRWYLKHVLHYKLAPKSFVHLGCFFLGKGIEIGEDSVIGANARLIGNIKIGKHCSITQDTFLETSTHEKNSPTFKGCEKPIEVGDYVWIGIRSVILPGVKIGNGAIIGANSTVSKDVEDYAVVAGSPAQKIGEREKEACQYILDYQPKWN